jgi:uncharacterized protein YndB with AHSA1/START domain
VAGETKQVVTGTVAAPPEAVFAVLADPGRHPEIDGSDMLQGRSGGSGPVTGVGQSFVMDMSHPALGQYQIRNEVIVFEPGRRIAWAPAPERLSPEIIELVGDIKIGGHHFAWDLEPAPGGETNVTHTCDWSGVEDERYAAFFPFISQEQMSQTLARLGAAVGSA